MTDDAEVTEAMIEAGVDVLLCELGALDFFWSARDLAE